MTRTLLVNLLAYCLQLTVVAGAAALVLWASGAREARLRYATWQAAFIIGLLLPLTALWPRTGDPSGAIATFVIGPVASTATAPGSRLGDAWLAVLVAGAAVRLAWLAVGLLALRRFVHRATPLASLTPVPTPVVSDSSIDVRISSDVPTPATVGWRRPVVLVPPAWLELPDAQAQAVLAHEAVHIMRRDWLRVCLEEVWCAWLWFHPAARFLAARLDLARETVVDDTVVHATGDRRSYAAALTAFSDGDARPLRLAAGLIRPRHLHVRLSAIAQGVTMSHRSRMLAASLVVLTLTATAAVALARVPYGSVAGPTTRQDVFEIGGDVSAPRVTYEVKPEYPQAALDAKVEGSVLLQTVVDVAGHPTRIAVVKSLDTEYGLDASAVTALEQWRFEPAEKGGTPVPVRVTVEMRFTVK